jgi:hypothetical protein
MWWRHLRLLIRNNREGLRGGNSARHLHPFAQLTYLLTNEYVLNSDGVMVYGVLDDGTFGLFFVGLDGDCSPAATPGSKGLTLAGDGAQVQLQR